MRKVIAAGNWKMNGTRAMTATLINEIKAGLGSDCQSEVLIFPSFGYLSLACGLIAGSPIKLGAQNLCTEASGAYTGEVSGEMLVDLGCTHVLVGHSERRAMYGDNSEIVAVKFEEAQQVGLIPVLCVGETLEQREEGQTEAVVGRQLEAVTNRVGVKALERSILAYEPVWAIGTGKTASPDQAQEVHAFLRRTIAAQNATIADSLQILYGGSVNGGNAAELFAMPDVDGGLVGGASLKSDQFLDICAAA
ncbi:MAG: triose-phosphate isomerase [Gammaproteobacteria bacterium]